MGWASLWRAGRRPCVSGRRLRDVDRQVCGRPLLPVPIGHVGKAGVLEAPRLWHFGLARRGDPRPCTDGGDVERLAIYCTLKTIYKYFGEGWRGGLPTSARLYAGELEELYRHSLKGLFSKVERLSDSTDGALSAAGEGGSPGSASTWPPWRFCRGCPRDARLLAGPVLGEVLGQRQNADALRAGEGVWLGVRLRR